MTSFTAGRGFVSDQLQQYNLSFFSLSECLHYWQRSIGIRFKTTKTYKLNVQ